MKKQLLVLFAVVLYAYVTTCTNATESWPCPSSGAGGGGGGGCSKPANTGETPKKPAGTKDTENTKTEKETKTPPKKVPPQNTRKPKKTKEPKEPKKNDQNHYSPDNVMPSSDGRGDKCPTETGASVINWDTGTMSQDISLVRSDESRGTGGLSCSLVYSSTGQLPPFARIMGARWSIDLYQTIVVDNITIGAFLYTGANKTAFIYNYEKSTATDIHFSQVLSQPYPYLSLNDKQTIRLISSDGVVKEFERFVQNTTAGNAFSPAGLVENYSDCLSGSYDCYRIRRIIYPNSQKTIFNYEGARLMSISDDYNSVLVFSHGPQIDGADSYQTLGGKPCDWIKDITTPDGHKFVLNYSEVRHPNPASTVEGTDIHPDAIYGGDVNEIILPNKKKYKFEYLHDLPKNYNREGLIAQKTRPDNSVVSYEYPTVNVVFSSDPEGTHSKTVNQISGFTNGVGLQLKKVTVASEFDIITKYKIVDQNNRVSEEYDINPTAQMWTKRIDGLGRVNERTIDGMGQVTRITDACGCGTGKLFSYDSKTGNIVSESDNLGLSKNWIYDEKNRIVVYQDKNGNISRYEYDEYNNPITETRPDGASSHNVYTSDGKRLIRRTDESGNVERFEYDTAGDLIKSISANGEVWLYTRDSLGRLRSKVRPDGATIAYEYDWAGNIVKQTDPSLDPKNATYVSYSYDFDGNMLSTTDSMGSTTSYYYDAQQKHIRTVYPDGTSEELTRDLHDNIVQRKNPKGIITRYDYDNANQLVKVTDSDENYVQYTYNERGQVLFFRNKESAISETRYDNAGRIIESIDPLGNAEKYFYDNSGNIIKKLDREGNELNYTYDALDRLTLLKLPNGTTEHYDYDLNSNIVASTNTRGTVTRYQYDALNRKVREIIDYGDGKLNVITDFAYDALSNISTITLDVGGQSQITAMTYDLQSRLVQKQFPDGVKNRFTYDANGNLTANVLLSQDNSLSLTESVSYNNRDVPTRTIDTAGLLSSFEYDANLNITKTMVDSEGAGALRIVTGVTYDNNNLPVSSVRDQNGPNQSITTFAYSANGWLTSTTDATNRANSAQYDAAGHVISQTDALGNVTRYVYNKNGQVIEQIDANGRSTYYVYDSLGRVTKQLNEMQQAVEYTYDAAGNRLTLKDAKGNISTWAYDALNHPVSLTYPDARVERYTYDRLGRLFQKTQPDASVITYNYDAAGRVSTITTREGVTGYQYDGLGRTTRMTSPGGNVSYSYDTAGRLSSVTDENLNKTVEYAYNRLGARSSMTVDGVQVTYGYDRLLNLATIQKTGETAPATYAYDAAGRRTALALPNGVTTNYGYDGAGQLTAIASKNAAQEVVSAFAYTLDPVGNRTAITQNIGGTVNSITYAYDDAYRLTRESRVDHNNMTAYDEQFTYDAVGNRIGRIRLQSGQPAESTAYTHDTANRLLTEATGGVTKNYSYDLNGNTTGIAGGGKNIAMQYDSLNRQTSWSDGTNTETQVYRGVGWQRSRTVANGTAVNYLYDGDNVVGDYDNAGVRQAYYVTPGLDENLSITNAQGAVNYYTQDGLGSVRSLTNAAGSLINKSDYTGFGEKYAANTVEGIANRYGYTGRENSYLASAGAPMFYRNRMYSPQVGRFLRVDPIGYYGSGSLPTYAEISANTFNDTEINPLVSLNQYHEKLCLNFSATACPLIYNDGNLFAYTHNRPINHSDPQGKFLQIVVIAAVVAVVAVAGYTVLKPDDTNPLPTDTDDPGKNIENAARNFTGKVNDANQKIESVDNAMDAIEFIDNPAGVLMERQIENQVGVPYGQKKVQDELEKASKEVCPH